MSLRLRGLNRPCRLRYTPRLEDGGWGCMLEIAMLVLCEGACVCLWSLYSMCFIANYRGDRDVEMNGNACGGEER